MLRAQSTQGRMKTLNIEVWSDIACPWCLVGKQRLEAALAEFPERAQVQVRWRAFELEPGAPAVQPAAPSLVERLATKYGMPVAEAQRRIDDMATLGRTEGIDFRFDRVRGGNTFDAHRVLSLAAERGVQAAAKARLMRAYFTEGEVLSDPETLIRLAGEVGLEAGDVRAALQDDARAEAVRAEEREARSLGISGVPCFVFDRRVGVSGAQPPEALLRVLREVWDALPESESTGEGPACGPDGCEV
jgi:predicted DsbA family dithiol-disulfide isomerase